MDEFSLIAHYFKPLDLKRDDVLLGIGEDAACVQVDHKMNLLISTDTLVAGIHFLTDWKAYDIAYRAVMVNVSDLAAMAAQPCWATLALTLPELNTQWLDSFAEGLKEGLNQFDMSLIGGDTTRGPLSITLTVFGKAAQGQTVSRSGAKPGDSIWVSGQLGAAALALELLDHQNIPKKDKEALMQKLLHPKPRVDLIPMLRSYASAAIDISDGLSADLNHICESSGVGACLIQKEIPAHTLLHQYCPGKSVDLALTGGDDYELCFTVPEHRLEAFKKEQVLCYPVGTIEKKGGLRMKTSDDQYQEIIPSGYSHFKT